MIYVKYRIAEDGVSRQDTPIHEKEFETDVDYYKWLRNQDGHPFLSIEIIQTEGHNVISGEIDDDCN